MTPRPGFVLDVDRSTPPILFHHGEQFRLEKLPPDRSRVIYPAEPLDPASTTPTPPSATPWPTRSTASPLAALLIAGHEAHHRLRRHLAPAAPDAARPTSASASSRPVLDMAAAAGVDDVHLIAALALHRRMTEAELRHAVGDRVYDAFAPDGRLYNHDAEDPDGMVVLGETRHGEEVQMNKRAAESDLIVYVNINIVSMDGGWKSTATGLSGYTRHPPPPQRRRRCASRSRFMDRHNSELHHSNWRQGEVIKRRRASRSSRSRPRSTTTPSATTARCRCSRSASGSGRPATGPRSSACRPASTRMPPRGPAQDLPGLAGALRADLGPGRRGRSGPRGHDCEHVFEQHLVPVEGQTDMLTMGLPYICPYNVNSIMNPILVMCLGLGYFFNLYRGKPLVREGGVLIMSHPTPWEFHPVHHPSYIDFFEQVLSDTTDPLEIEQQVREAVRRGRVVPPPVPHVVRLPRRPPVLHVVLGRPRPAAPRRG